MTSVSPLLPKIVWTFWAQGWDLAPEIVRASTTTWSRQNPDWQIRRLNWKNVPGLFAPTSPYARLINLDLDPCILSEFVRLELLARFGGVWADATTYCLVPLDGWLQSAVPKGFFAFDRPGPDRMLSSWFLAADKASPTILLWRTLAEQYWAQRSARHAYFWLHYLFADAYEADANFRKIWDATPKISADGPHAFAPYQQVLYAPLTESARQIVEAGTKPNRAERIDFRGVGTPRWWGIYAHAKANLQT
jgi:hypothetical protein